MRLELRDPWFLQMLIHYMPSADLLVFVQASGFLDKAVTQWCGLTSGPFVLDESGLRGLCSNPRQIGVVWRMFFWRCLRMLSAEHLRSGREALLRDKHSVEQWFKVGDDIAGDMLIPDEDYHGRVWRTVHGQREIVFGHTIFFHPFKFDPQEVKHAFSSPNDRDDGWNSCTSESILVKLPPHGLCSLQLELIVVDDGVVFELQTRSADPVTTDTEVIEAMTSEVIAICPTGPDWELLDKYTYYDPDIDDSDNDFLLPYHRDMYAQVVQALQDGLPLPLLVASAGPRLPEEEARVMRLFM